MRLWRGIVVCAAVPVGWIAVGAVASRDRQPARVPLRLSPAGLRLDVRRLVELGDAVTSAAKPIAVARDSKGRYLVASEDRRTGIEIYGPDGVHLRTLGRHGQGPGEFEWAGGVAVDGRDSIHVVDVVQRRWTVLGPDGTYARSAPIPGAYQWAMAPSAEGRVLLNLFVGDVDGMDSPVVELRPGGATGARFGAEPGSVVRRGLASTKFRRFARAPDGTVWIARINQYVLDVWSASGQRLEGYTRIPAPFEPWVDTRPPSPDRPPQEMVVAVAVGTDRRVWILIRVPDREWRTALSQVTTEEGRAYVPSDADRLYDTLVEVIDPDARRVVHSQRVPQFLQGFVAPGLAFSVVNDGTEVARTAIWQLQLVSPTGRE